MNSDPADHERAAGIQADGSSCADEARCAGLQQRDFTTTIATRLAVPAGCISGESGRRLAARFTIPARRDRDRRRNDWRDAAAAAAAVVSSISPPSPPLPLFYVDALKVCVETGSTPLPPKAVTVNAAVPAAVDVTADPALVATSIEPPSPPSPGRPASP